MKKHLLSALLAMCLVTTAFAQQGKVYETRTVKSKILGMERSYSIYLPAGYDEGDGSYPVLYLLHGIIRDGCNLGRFSILQIKRLLRVNQLR